MTIEDRMRRALGGAPEPEGDGWARIEEKVATAEQRRRRGRIATVVVGAAAVLAVAFAVGAMVADDGDDQTVDVGPADTSTTTTAEESTTSTSTSTVITVPAAEVDTFVWRGDAATPEDAARAFMHDFVGVPDPIVAGVHQGDSRSWEVDVVPRPGLDGLMTTVLVREDDGGLGVLGSNSVNVELDSPMSGDPVAGTVPVRGRARAFEGTVNVEVRDDFGRALATGIVTGRGDGNLGEFAGGIAITPTEAEAGALILSTASAEDGSVQEATVIRVVFGAGTARCTAPFEEVPPPVVRVFLLCPDNGGDPVTVAVERTAPDQGVLRAAVEFLLAGPNTEEADAGLQSMFSKDTGRMLRSVSIDDGRAVVDFERGLAEAIPNASTSAGSGALLAQLDATVFQFESIDSVEYRLDGSCEEFMQWIQGGPCQPFERP